MAEVKVELDGLQVRSASISLHGQWRYPEMSLTHRPFHNKSSSNSRHFLISTSLLPVRHSGCHLRSTAGNTRHHHTETSPSVPSPILHQVTFTCCRLLAGLMSTSRHIIWQTCFSSCSLWLSDKEELLPELDEQSSLDSLTVPESTEPQHNAWGEAWLWAHLRLAKASG